MNRYYPVGASIILGDIKDFKPATLHDLMVNHFKGLGLTVDVIEVSQPTWIWILADPDYREVLDKAVSPIEKERYIEGRIMGSEIVINPKLDYDNPDYGCIRMINHKTKRTLCASSWLV